MELDLENACHAASKSRIAQACRRMLFNYTESVRARGQAYLADMMYGLGTGTLIRLRGDFFLLTSKHVLTTNGCESPQNESPLWTHKNHPPKHETLADFLFAAKWYAIGDLVLPGPVEWSIDVRDIALVELFYPIGPSFPGPFLDLDASNFSVLALEELPGLLLLVNGFPFLRNAFKFYDAPREGITHQTDIQRHTIAGVCKLVDGQPIVSFESTEGTHTAETLNGFSGGVVCNVHMEAALTRWVGLACSAGGGICRFIPAEILMPAILRYRESPCTVLDPASSLATLSLTREQKRERDQMLYGNDPWFQAMAS